MIRRCASRPVLPDGEPRPVRRRRPGHLRAGARRHDRGRRAGSSPGWSTPTATSGSTTTARSTTRRPRQQAIDDRDAGALLIRDCGSAADTAWIHDRDDLPRLIRAGRHIARTRRYIRNYAHEVEPHESRCTSPGRPSAATAGSSWSGTGSRATSGDLAPSFPAGGVRRGDRGRARARRQGDRALLRRGGAAGAARRRDRLHRARHRVVRRPVAQIMAGAASRWCRRSCRSTSSRSTPRPGRDKFPRMPTT